MLPHILAISLMGKTIWIDKVGVWILEAVFAEKGIHRGIGVIVLIIPVVQSEVEIIFKGLA
jgi:hypothetical protein